MFYTPSVPLKMKCFPFLVVPLKMKRFLKWKQFYLYFFISLTLLSLHQLTKQHYIKFRADSQMLHFKWDGGSIKQTQYNNIYLLDIPRSYGYVKWSPCCPLMTHYSHHWLLNWFPRHFSPNSLTRQAGQYVELGN